MAPRRIEQAGPNTAYLETLAARIKTALVGGLQADYELGRLIWEVKRGGYWSRNDWPGAPEGGYAQSKAGFVQWCWEVLGKKERAAAYHERNYRLLSEMSINETSELFHRCLKLGWSKLAHILPMAKNADEVRAWVDRIDREKLTENDLRVQSKLHHGRAPAATKAQPGAAASQPTTQSAPATAAAPPPDAVVTRDADGTFRDAARNRIDPDTGEILDPPVPNAVKDTRVEFKMTFENADAAKVFWRGIDVIKRRGALSNGEAAARMAQIYLATTTHEDEGGLVEELDSVLRGLERAYGVRLGVLETADAATEGFGT